MKKIKLLILLLVVTALLFAQRKRAPMYFSAYAYLYTVNQNSNTTKPMPESMWQHNIDYMAQNLAPMGFNMICTDGWGEDIRNSDGFRIKHHSSWSHDFAYWGNYAKSKGIKLGLYENPLWINDQVAATKGLYNPNENAMWFHWLQVNNSGAEDYLRRYIEYYKSFGVDYLRVDFLSWYEDGKDKSSDLTQLHGRSVADYQKALSWLNKYCDANSIQLSLVMPHLYNHGANERTYAPGSLIRVNEDVCEGKWNRFSDFDRGIKHPIWSQYWNTFDGMIYWSDISGFDDTKQQMIMDGDFLWLSSFANDDEKRSAISLNLMAGGAIAITEYNIEDIQQSIHLLRNQEVFALNADGFVGKPLFTNDVTNEASQVWAGQMSNGDWIVGLFNRENSVRNRSLDFKWLNNLGTVNVRDLWEQKSLGAMSSVSFDVPAHGCKILRLSKSEIVTHQSSMNFAGSFNNWKLSDYGMTLVNGVWTKSGVSFTAGNHQLKFANSTNWSGADWGNSSGLSGTAKLTTGGGANILFSIPSTGSYTVKFNDVTLAYSIVKEGFVANQTQLFVGGTFNSWTLGNNPMTLVADNTWQSAGISLAAGNYQLKIANKSDWSGTDWGNATGLIGTAKVTTGGGANISFSIATSGTYFVVFNDQILAYSISTSLKSKLNSEGAIGSEQISIYPNPATDMVYIDLTHAGKSVVEVFDMMGKLLYTKVMEASLNEISVDDLNTQGVVSLRISNKDGIWIKKVVLK